MSVLHTEQLLKIEDRSLIMGFHQYAIVLS